MDSSEMVGLLDEAKKKQKRVERLCLKINELEGEKARLENEIRQTLKLAQHATSPAPDQSTSESTR